MKNVGRKVYHLFGGLLLLAVFYGLGRTRAFIVYALLLAAILSFDLLRLRHRAFNEWALGRLGTFLRPGEAETISGSPSYIVGAAAALFLFELPIATAAVLFLAVGDVAASVVGEAWGSTRLGSKSIEGTAAFIVAGFLAGLAARLAGPGVPVPVLAAGALTAAVVEVMTPRRVNDNLAIPLTSGLIMTLLQWSWT